MRALSNWAFAEVPSGDGPTKRVPTTSVRSSSGTTPVSGEGGDWARAAQMQRTRAHMQRRAFMSIRPFINVSPMKLLNFLSGIEQYQGFLRRCGTFESL